MKKALIILLSMLILFTGCFIGDEFDFDLTGLDEKIDEAESAKEGLDVAADASQVHPVRKWVTSGDMAAFKAAITAAEKTRDKAASQSEVDDAVTALDTAIIKFKSQIQTNGTKTSGFTQQALTTLIKEAENAKADVQASSNNGKDVSKEKYWVPDAIMDSLTGAINSAKSPPGIDVAYNNLVTALDNFYKSRQPGTGTARSITITDLTQYNFINGTDIEIGLFTNNNPISKWNPVIHGSGTIRNDKVTVILYTSSGIKSVLWTGNGLYYVRFRAAGEKYISKEKVNFSNDKPNPTLNYYNFEDESGDSD